MSLNPSAAHIALFGFNLRLLNELKNQIRQIIPQHISIEWCNIAEPNLTALLISDIFFDSPSIQNLIASNNLNYLKLVKDPDRQGQIEGNILYLPILNSLPLSVWLMDRINAQARQATSRPAQPSPVPSSAPQPITQQDIVNKNRLLREFLNPKNGNVRVFDQIGDLGLVDMRTELFMAEPSRQRQLTDMTVNFTYATMQESSRFDAANAMPVFVWFWNLMWRSPDFMVFAPKRGYYKLRFWPQPLDTDARRDVLRLSACFIQGASMEQVASHLDLPIERVQRFVAAGMTSSLMIQITENEANFRVKQPDTPAGERETSVVRKLFSSLRRRLGF